MPANPPRRIRLAVVSAVAAGFLAVSGEAPAVQFDFKYRVVAAAADGPAAVVAVARRGSDPASACADVVLLDRRGRKAVLSGRQPPVCGDERFWVPEAGPALALATDSAAWVTMETDVFLMPHLHVARIGGRRVVDRWDGGEIDTGPYVGPLAGDGPDLFVNVVRTPYVPAGCEPDAAPGASPPPCAGLGEETGEILRTRGLGVVASGPDGRFLEAVDARRLLVRRPDGTVAVLSENGAVIASIDPPEPAESAALSGPLVAVAAGSLVHVFAIPGGVRIASFQTGGRIGRVDLSGSTLVYRTARAMVGIDVIRGTRFRLLVLPSGGRTVDVQVEGRRATYVWNDARRRGHVILTTLPTTF